MIGTPVSLALAQDPTATPTDTPTPTPTATGTPTDTPTPTPNLYLMATTESGQTYAEEYIYRPMETVFATEGLILIGIGVACIFLLMVIVRRLR
jgi:hypothetical protein